MSPTTAALVLLTAQRHHLEALPDERVVTRAWQARVEAARTAGHLIVHVQWEGAPGTPGETFSRGWVLHPDFRSEATDLLLRATEPDAFSHSGLDAALRERGVRELHLLALPGVQVLAATAATARALGYRVEVLEDRPAPLGTP